MTLIAFTAPRAIDSDIRSLPPTHTVVEPKLDGVRAIVHCHPVEGVRIQTRGDKFIEDKVPQLRDHPVFHRLARQGYTILDGELAPADPSGPDSFTQTMRVVGSLPVNAVAAQKADGPLNIYLFDACRWKGDDISHMPLRDRRKWYLENVTRGLPHIEVMESVDLGSSEDRVARVAAHLQMYEGSVIKNPNAAYFDPAGWLKVKERVTIDAQVTGWVFGAGKFEGTIGSLQVAAFDEETGEMKTLCNVSPGTDEVRAKMFERLVGKSRAAIRNMEIIVELEGQCWTTGGMVRHPRILRYRPDKDWPNTVQFQGNRSKVVA